MIIPFVDNLIIYDYPYLDTVEDIENLSYDDFVNTIKNIDFSNYSCLTIKNEK